ncbi:Mitogen-activated protein kinase kinase kinase [Sesamum angolense]|uniref:Mitogen-activated protein kinase kinase kinase n=1 Tax=Sesamum angolense TaxID=2727404 RepID=A0AAE1WLP7_9LAMI|nr:Mitogen-activated protein kinase kinase kinase [Sesamum angolense]
MAGKGRSVVQEKGVNEYGDGAAWIRGSMIGKGGFGCVYLATLRNPRSKYSCLPPVMAVKSAEVSVSGSIQKEREVLSNLKGCCNIIRCFGEETTVGDNGVMVYNLLLEYGSGGTLADRIKKSGGDGLPEFEVRVYAKSILRGLNYIHGNGYVHCDLKPDNILLVRNAGREGSGEFRAKIGDFGLAKRAKQSKKRKLEAYWRGTPMYLSPEAVIDNVQDAPCDVWALGCIVLEMLTGKPPWDGKKELKAEELLSKIGAGRELPKIPSGISKEARDFLKGCFVRKSMYRLTSEMLLNHPFVEGLDDGDAVAEIEDVQDLNKIESVASVSDSDDELSCGLFPDEWGDASEDDSFSYWSEEDVDDEEDEIESCSAEGEEESEVEEIKDVMGSSCTNAGLDQSNEMPKQISSQSLPKRRQHYPVSLTIRAGI